MDGFGGIGSEIGGGRIADAVNFRIGSDGALEKRCGYRCLADVGLPVRACYSGLFEGRFAIFLLAGDTVYSLDLADETLSALYTVANAEGNACFFCLRGVLYLMDGGALYELRDGQALPAVGYAPLFGKDWPNDIVGEICEPRNLLTRHARISYVVGQPASAMLCTKYAVESVEAVYLNQVLMSPEDYQIDPTFNTVNIPGLVSGDRVLIYLTFKNGVEALPESFYSCTEAILFGGVNRNRLFFRGGSLPSVLFCSAYVDEESRAESQRHYPGAAPLYIPEGYEFTVGDGRYRIRGTVPYHDRLLIFTEGDTWMAKEDTSGLAEFPIIPVHAKLGCFSENGAVAMGNEVLSMGRHAVLTWKDAADALDRCTVRSISDEVSSFLAKADSADWGLFYHEAEHVLLCYCRTSGDVLLYNPDRDCWYRYTGLYADAFFDANGRIGFWKGGQIFLLDPSLSEDHPASGEPLPICAEYAGERMDLGSEQKKILAGITLYGCFEEDIGEWSLTEDGKRTVGHSLVCHAPSDYAVLRRRTPSGRFRHASFRLTARGTSRPILHRLSLHIR